MEVRPFKGTAGVLVVESAAGGTTPAADAKSVPLGFSFADGQSARRCPCLLQAQHLNVLCTTPSVPGTKSFEGHSALRWPSMFQTGHGFDPGTTSTLAAAAFTGLGLEAALLESAISRRNFATFA